MSRNIFCNSMRSLSLTAMGLVFSLGLSGCAATSTTATFDQVISTDNYAALAPAAGPEQVPLITALEGMAPSGTSFAFANDVDINMPVTPASSALSVEQRLLTMLSSAGLKTRMAGRVIYIEHGTMPAPVAEAVSPATHVLVPPPQSGSAPQLMGATMMNAPVVAPGERLHQTSANPVPADPVPVAPVAPQPEPEVMLGSASAQTSAAAMVAAMPSSSSTRPVADPAEPELLATTRPLVVPPPASNTAPMMLEQAYVAPLPAPAEVQPPTEINSAPAPVVAPVAASVPAVPRAVVADPVALAASDVNDRAQLATPTGVASDVLKAAQQAVAGSWQADRGQTLRTVLDAWCARANVQLVWSTDFDYPLSASISLDDNFENAVRTLLTGFSSISPQPVARLHRQGNAGQRVLIVETRGNLYQE